MKEVEYDTVFGLIKKSEFRGSQPEIESFGFLIPGELVAPRFSSSFADPAIPNDVEEMSWQSISFSHDLNLPPPPVVPRVNRRCVSRLTGPPLTEPALSLFDSGHSVICRIGDTW